MRTHPAILALMAAMFAVVVIMDVFLVGAAARQVRAESYPVVRGVVLESGVVRDSGGKGGPHFRADIRYRYEANGRTYESSAYRHGFFPTDDARSAQEIARAHPAGSAIDVHYNPRDPAEAVLRPGLIGADVFFLLFALPFNIIAGAMAWGAAGWLVRKVRGAPAPPEDDDISPAGIAMAAAFAAAFLSSVIIVVTSGFSPSMPIAVGGWIVTLVVSAGAFVWARGARA